MVAERKSKNNTRGYKKMLRTNLNKYGVILPEKMGGWLKLIEPDEYDDMKEIASGRSNDETTRSSDEQSTQGPEKTTQEIAQTTEGIGKALEYGHVGVLRLPLNLLTPIKAN